MKTFEELVVGDRIYPVNINTGMGFPEEITEVGDNQGSKRFICGNKVICEVGEQYMKSPYVYGENYIYVTDPILVQLIQLVINMKVRNMAVTFKQIFNGMI